MWSILLIATVVEVTITITVNVSDGDVFVPLFITCTSKGSVIL